MFSIFFLLLPAEAYILYCIKQNVTGKDGVINKELQNDLLFYYFHPQYLPSGLVSLTPVSSSRFETSAKEMKAEWTLPRAVYSLLGKDSLGRYTIAHLLGSFVTKNCVTYLTLFFWSTRQSVSRDDNKELTNLKVMLGNRSSALKPFCLGDMFTSVLSTLSFFLSLKYSFWLVWGKL